MKLELRLFAVDEFGRASQRGEWEVTCCLTSSEDAFNLRERQALATFIDEVRDAVEAVEGRKT